jgi:AraC family transcriptional regulator, transcriptional activator of pobA
MDTIRKLEKVAEFCKERGQRTMHPLVSVLDQSKSTPIKEGQSRSELYIIFLKEGKSGELRYGRQNYDYEDGTMLFIAPGQVFGHQGDGNLLQPSGWALVFHPDLIRGTSLGRNIKEYNFFSYDVNEALHLSDRERRVIIDCFEKIQYELDHPVDKHSRELVVSTIELLLKYCVRFYDRQFITRDYIHKGVLTRFEELLDSYLSSEKPQTSGLPSVSFFAEQVHLSPKYFGDLVKKETGISAQEYIQSKVVDVAKDKMLSTDKSVAEIGYELGFKYPPHFTRLFKQKVGQSPQKYRKGNALS